MRQSTFCRESAEKPYQSSTSEPIVAGTSGIVNRLQTDSGPHLET
jgi:hypothetical protein